MFSSFNQGITQRIATALAAGAFTATALLPSGALAVEREPNQTSGQQQLPTQLPSCSAKSWPTPTVIVHTGTFPGSSTDLSKMEDAVRDINAQMGKVGASSANVPSTKFSTEAFHTSPQYLDQTPTIHVGFTNLPDTELGLTSTEISCEHYIMIDRDTTWDYGTPEDSVTDGDRYYNVGHTDAAGNYYFRISYQHELLHAFMVGANDPGGHPTGQYSFLNYGARPWANVAPDAMIRPLPWDVGQLRNLYPESGSRVEIAALNTWIDKAGFTGAGDTLAQKLLCKPSVGARGTDDQMFAPYCGNDKATTICPGDTVLLRYVAANYSTEPLTVNANYWFSADEDWQNTDTESTSAQAYWLDPEKSVEEPDSVVVPDLNGFPGKAYHLIVRLTGETTTGTVVHDSIPMRGLLTLGTSCAVSSTLNTGGAATAPLH